MFNRNIRNCENRSCSSKQKCGFLPFVEFVFWGLQGTLCYYQKFMKVDSSLIGTLLKADIGNCVIAH